MLTLLRAPVFRPLVVAAIFAAAAWGQPAGLFAQAPKPATNVKFAQVGQDDMKEWLTYLASDELQGRQVFTEGYGLAAQYIAERLKAWGVKPLAADGGYLQPVRLRGYKATRNSKVTVESEGQTTTFRHDEHVSFAANAGGRQTLTFDGFEFVGSRIDPGRDLKGKLAVIVPAQVQPGARGAAALTAATGAAASAAPAIPGAPPAATIRFAPAPPSPSAAEQALTQAQTALTQAAAAVAEAQRGLRAGRAGQPNPAVPPGGRGGQAAPTADFTTVQRLDGLVAPQITGDEMFLAALFAGSGTSFAEIRAKAEKGETQTPMTVAAKVTITIDNSYEVVSQQVTHNVVGLIEGTDGRLRDSYIAYGAHLDHLGYSQTGNSGRAAGTDTCRRRSDAAQAAVVAAGKVVQRPSGRGAVPPGGARGTGTPAPAVPMEQRDVISNGADDDGSGSTALLAIAKAFATGPKPKRSIIVIWHAGEENGLYGSRFNADFPIVPLEKIQTVLNIDMVGRDDCNNIEGDFSNTLFVVGADRISSDLHNLIVETNRTQRSPLTLDYELNDPQDPEGVYQRSDHFSYASKGIPVAFFTTGLHPDYHRVSDTVDKIRFDKLARIAQLAYETGFAVADTERTLTRDNKGPRTGFGSKAEMLK